MIIMGGTHMIQLLRVPSADTLPFLFHAKIGASLPNSAVEDDILMHNVYTRAWDIDWYMAGFTA